MKEISSIAQSALIPLHDEDWIRRQRQAGKVLAQIMTKLESIVACKEEISLLALDEFVEKEILLNNCTPTFKNYKGYPNSLITSVNKQMVHGIPSPYKLKEGDMISFDFGVTFEGAIVDSATTMIFGQSKPECHRMVETGKECLYNAIKAIKPGKRLGVIGNAIFKTARNKGFNVIDQFGGHGIGEEVHSSPFVANRASPDSGVHLTPGMSLAIEPLLVPGSCSTTTKKDADGWTIYTDERSCHEEHTIFIHQDRVEIMTHRKHEGIEREIFFE